MNADQTREQARLKDGKFGTQPHARPDRGLEPTTYPLSEVRSDRALRVESDPETWARSCPQCPAVFTVVGDATSVGTLTSDLAHHVTEAHNEVDGQIFDALPAPAPVRVGPDPRLMPAAWASTPTDGSPNNPVRADDPRLLMGEVFDAVEDSEGTGRVFHRSRPGVSPSEPYAMRFQTDRELTTDEAEQLAGLIGYHYRVTVSGESMEYPRFETPFAMNIGADTTKSRRDDLGQALHDFEAGLPEIIRDGSPLRTTDRAGAGTKGTRLIEGFGGRTPKLEIYYDDVVVG